MASVDASSSDMGTFLFSTSEFQKIADTIHQGVEITDITQQFISSLIDNEKFLPGVENFTSIEQLLTSITSTFGPLATDILDTVIATRKRLIATEPQISSGELVIRCYNTVSYVLIYRVLRKTITDKLAYLDSLGPDDTFEADEIEYSQSGTIKIDPVDVYRSTFVYTLDSDLSTLFRRNYFTSLRYTYHPIELRRYPPPIKSQLDAIGGLPTLSQVKSEFTIRKPEATRVSRNAYMFVFDFTTRVANEMAQKGPETFGQFLNEFGTLEPDRTSLTKALVMKAVDLVITYNSRYGWIDWITGDDVYKALNELSVVRPLRQFTRE